MDRKRINNIINTALLVFGVVVLAVVTAPMIDQWIAKRCAGCPGCLLCEMWEPGHLRSPLDALRGR
jgi:hypothetical protein